MKRGFLDVDPSITEGCVFDGGWTGVTDDGDMSPRTLEAWNLPDGTTGIFTRYPGDVANPTIYACIHPSIPVRVPVIRCMTPNALQAYPYLVPGAVEFGGVVMAKNSKISYTRPDGTVGDVEELPQLVDEAEWETWE